MNRRRCLALSSALFAGSLAGCTSDAAPGSAGDSPTRSTPEVDPDVTDEALSRLVAGTNAAAFDLFDALRTADAGPNLMASPVSVSTALAMVYAGARGETRSQMRDALGFDLEDETLHAAFNRLQRTLDGRGEDLAADELPTHYDESDDPVPFELSLANAVWSQEDLAVREAYSETLADHYGGALTEVDFAGNADAVRERINDWVREETGGRIRDLLPQGALTPRTVLVLTNAVYFRANWRYPFDERRTEPAPFTALDGSTTEVPMMSVDESFPAAAVDGVDAVELPYVGGDASMLVLVPPAGSFESYEAGLDAAEVARVVDALETQRGYVELPRFAFDSSFQLEAALSAMGMPDAFRPGSADFSGMVEGNGTTPRLFLDQVYHDTRVTVDEAGTEAAAATGAVVNYVSRPPTLLRADRPFLFVIRDRPTGTVLFVGRVADAGVAQA